MMALRLSNQKTQPRQNKVRQMSVRLVRFDSLSKRISIAGSRIAAASSSPSLTRMSMRKQSKVAGKGRELAEMSTADFAAWDEHATRPVMNSKMGERQK